MSPEERRPGSGAGNPSSGGAHTAPRATDRSPSRALLDPAWHDSSPGRRWLLAALVASLVIAVVRLPGDVHPTPHVGRGPALALGAVAVALGALVVVAYARRDSAWVPVVVVVLGGLSLLSAALELTRVPLTIGLVVSGLVSTVLVLAAVAVLAERRSGRSASRRG
jgi:hypothetical protein